MRKHSIAVAVKAAFFLLFGCMLVVSLVTGEYSNSWIYATSLTMHQKNIFLFLSIFIGHTIQYMVGFIASFWIAVSCVITSLYLFYKKIYKDDDVYEYERTAAFFGASFFLSPLVAMHAYYNDLEPLAGGIVGYKWCLLMQDHMEIAYFCVSIFFLMCVLGGLQFAGIFYIRKLISLSNPIMEKFFSFIPIYKKPLYKVGVWLIFYKDTLASYFRSSGTTICSKTHKIIIDELFMHINSMQSTGQVYLEQESLGLPGGNGSGCDIPSVVDQSVVNVVHSVKMYQSVPDDLFDKQDGVDQHLFLKKELKEKALLLEKKLERFGIHGKIVNVNCGPLVTVFEYEPHIDTKLSKIVSLEDDLTMVLQSLSVRILAPIPGKAVVGFEVANTQRQPVTFKQLFVSDAYKKGNRTLPLILGLDTSGKEVIGDLITMPHLLIAGSTGSGKSVALNSMLVSLLSQNSFLQMRLILIDPKRLEFMSYAAIPHLLFPIITDPKKSIVVLKWLTEEMNRRYQLMAGVGARDCNDYNKRQHKSEERLPFIVIVIDELADLMITVGKEIEELIIRITQMARAAGIHMIVATQRPSVDVITGVIKVNFTSRIALRVASRTDSRTILDSNGAERLLTKGDMLFLDGTTGQLRRVHGPYISSQEIEKVVKHLMVQGPVNYLDIDTLSSNVVNTCDKEDEQLYLAILVFLAKEEYVSISLLQRKFHIGYNRSARMIELLEQNGLILPSDGSKMRRVIR